MSADRRTLDELLDAARAQIARLEPADAHAATEQGALLIDIRGQVDRERDGIVPGSLHIPRTVLEWRLDPESSWHNPHVPRHGNAKLCNSCRCRSELPSVARAPPHRAHRDGRGGRAGHVRPGEGGPRAGIDDGAVPARGEDELPRCRRTRGSPSVRLRGTKFGTKFELGFTPERRKPRRCRAFGVAGAGFEPATSGL